MSNFSKNELTEKVMKPLVAKYADLRRDLKKKIRDPNLSMEERFKLQRQLDSLPKRSSAIRIQRRCLFSYRTRSVDRYTGLNYYHMLQAVSRGNLPGFTLASW